MVNVRKRSGDMKKYICIFCDERKDIETAFKTDRKIGICHDCRSKLLTSPFSTPYAGSGDVSYIISPFKYKGSLRDVLLKFKFENHWAYAKLISSLADDYLSSFDIWDSFDYIVPIPLHKQRIKERGYNQSELLCTHISEYTGVKMNTKLLTRIRNTKKQSMLSLIDRTLNIQNAFHCSSDLTGKNIIIFDDICTSGTTLCAGASALSKANASHICALTFAIQND